MVTNGSYIGEYYPELCSAAFILECMQVGGRVTGTFPKASIDTNAFQGSLMAVHLLLLVVNTVSSG